MDKFELYELTDEQLNEILSLRDQQQELYINTLIQRFYPEVDEQNYIKLQIAYKSSFILEKFYRSNLVFQEGFQAIYTRTGLIRDIINEVYFTQDNLITH